MERGQSTIEVAIAFPVVVILLWWAIIAPLAGIRAVAARTAAVGPVRLAAVEDSPAGDTLAAQVRRRWQKMAGNGGRQEVKATCTKSSVAVAAREFGGALGSIRDFSLALPRETD